MSMGSRCRLLVTLGLALLVASCHRGNTPPPFIDAISRADKVVLYEGLPHPNNESSSFAKEQRTKAVQELNGYSFYQEPLPLTSADAQRLAEIMSRPATYMPFTGEKKCGGFHPDYAVEWRLGADRYRALICFGCGEVKLFGPKIETRHDLDWSVRDKLQEVLKSYRQNRPAAKNHE